MRGVLQARQYAGAPGHAARAGGDARRGPQSVAPVARDRSSAARDPASHTADRVEVIELRLRMSSAEVAECLDIALSTVSAVLKRMGLGKLSPLGRRRVAVA